MPNVTFAPGVISSPRALYTAIENMTTTATLVSFSGAELVLSMGQTVYVIHGSGITTGLVGGQPVLTGGTLTGVDVSLNGVAQMAVTGLSILAVDLQSAIVADKSGADNSAVENLFLPLGYSYHGNANADILLATDMSSDGIPLNLSGNDTMFSGGGDDHIFLGSGNDIAHGDIGNDTFEGSLGNDKLFGEGNNDKLYGGDNNDQLFGGTGADSLDGGAGKDKISGGAGNDTMTGGSGADTFVFALHDGADRITGFNTAQDFIDLPAAVTHSFTSAPDGSNLVLHYGTFGDTIQLVGLHDTDATLIQFI